MKKLTLTLVALLFSGIATAADFPNIYGGFGLVGNPDLGPRVEHSETTGRTGNLEWIYHGFAKNHDELEFNVRYIAPTEHSHAFDSLIYADYIVVENEELKSDL